MLTRGESVPSRTWRAIIEALEEALDRVFSLEETVVFPSARALLTSAELESLFEELRACERSRPDQTIDFGEITTALPRIVRAVHTRICRGLETIHSYADCPRRITVDVETSCAACAHFN